MLTCILGVESSPDPQIWSHFLVSLVHKASCGSPVPVLPYTLSLIPIHFLSNKLPVVSKCIMLTPLHRMVFLDLYAWEFFSSAFKDQPPPHPGVLP